MTTPIKALFAAIATAAIAVSASAPAVADPGWGHGDRDGYGFRQGNAGQAVSICSRIAEREARRGSFGHARVTDIRDVRDTRWGYEVRGRLAVTSREHGWNDRGYGRGDYGRNDYNRGWGDNYRRRDSGSFTCRIERGRVAYLDIDGIRGL